MGLGRTLLRFPFLAAIGHHVTYTVVEGGIFEDMRNRAGAIHPKLDEFVHWHLREVQVKQNQIDSAEANRIDDSAPIEIDRATIPGISIRS
jgi:hypothetical protein